MIISIQTTISDKQPAEIIVAGAYKLAQDKIQLALTPALISLFEKPLLKLVAEERFKAEAGSVLVAQISKSGVRRVVLVGMGGRGPLAPEAWRRAAASALLSVKSLGAKQIGFILAQPEAKPEIAQAIAEGVLLGQYGFTPYKEETSNRVEGLHFFLPSAQKGSGFEDHAKRGIIFADAAIAARHLVNTPAQHLSPKDLVEATAMAMKDLSCIQMTTLDKAALTELKADALLSIAQGSDHEPYLVHLVYRPKKTSKKKLKKIALVGKAITFDSGGLSLKPANSMMTMKCDMAGAAAVIGIFTALEALQPEAEIHGIYGACENMPSGSAVRPGDVVRALNGKTIEILNTDAEGRVTLADTLTYAGRLKPDVMIDLATLTGACLVALGEQIAGLMTNDVGLSEEIQKSAQKTGERVWPLPLPDDYKKDLKSEIADYKNIGGSWGGAISAGLFLKEFVGSTPWVHLDIAGPAYAEKPFTPYERHGGTGFGVRLLLEWVMGL